MSAQKLLRREFKKNYYFFKGKTHYYKQVYISKKKYYRNRIYSLKKNRVYYGF